MFIFVFLYVEMCMHLSVHFIHAYCTCMWVQAGRSAIKDGIACVGVRKLFHRVSTGTGTGRRGSPPGMQATDCWGRNRNGTHSCCNNNFHSNLWRRETKGIPPSSLCFCLISLGLPCWHSHTHRNHFFHAMGVMRKTAFHSITSISSIRRT